MKKKLTWAFIFMLVLGAIGYAAGFAFTYLGEQNVTAALTSDLALILLGVCAAGGAIIGLCTKSKSIKTKNRGVTTEGEETDIAFDSKFISPDEMRRDKELIFATWNTLPETMKTGFVFRMKKHGGKFEVNMKPETHALVLGTTGTGKTQLLANPTIRILSHSGQKPSLVMTDPKGELYEDNAEVLRKEGYNVIVLNLNDPYESSMWNPMEIAYNTYQRANNLASEVKKYIDCTPEDMGFTRIDESDLNGVTYGNTWYGFEGKAFPTHEMIKNELISQKIKLEDEAKSDLRNIALSLIPDDPQCKDPTWPNGCRDFITGLMYAMLEDTRDPRLGMTKEKFNFFNLYKMAMKRDQAGERESQLKTLAKYSQGRDTINGNVEQLMSTVCGAASVTQRSFLSTLGSSVGKTLGDDGILYVTSGTDIDFTTFADKPTAFFIRIPDHKTERHPIGVLCISQLYKVLVDVANKTINPKNGKKGQLKRPVYFILDEFGNMPAVPGFGTMVTVARSRNIFFEIILQSYTQLDIKYGQEEAKNIRGNFQMETFLGSEDPSTIQAFSEACGETTVFHEEENRSRNTKDSSAGENISTSTQRTRKPLIDKQELRQLPRWTIIAKIFRKRIMKDIMTPFFECDFMEKRSSKMPARVSKPIDVSKIFYDVEKRNQIVFGSRVEDDFNF
ncbi:MAG: type IV secretory system conjugative DNA transfer family protein [Clostridia bacterium]|nr:type IV secretory system conjugative DNA transfer family protein [Clostridia bacterium]